MEEGINLAVTNYRTPDDLQHFLMSLEKHPPTVPWDLVVVNVDPLDRDVDVAQRYVTRWNDQITYLSFAENVGYGKATNNAALLGKREIFAAFNADTRFTENVLDACYTALKYNPEWSILGPRQLDDRGLITHAGVFNRNGHRFERGFHASNSNEYQDIRTDVAYVSGSAFFVKRTAWESLTACEHYQDATPGALGAFLESQLFYEDSWCCLHLNEHPELGITVYYGPASMIHLHHQSVAAHKGHRFIADARMLFQETCQLHGIDPGLF